MMESKILGLIPARFNSSRFPGKMLHLINDRPLIVHTYLNALNSGVFDRLIVATDDERILTLIHDLGGEAVMTDASCPTGSDRIAQALMQCSSTEDFDIVVNIQGDEPSIKASVFQDIIQSLKDDKSAQVSTALVSLQDEKDILDPSIVKCVFNQKRQALYFSRAPIPLGKTGVDLSQHRYYGHHGVYAFRRDFLLQYVQLAATPLQLAEDLEQLKILEHGYSIAVALVDESVLGVDTLEDINKVVQHL